MRENPAVADRETDRQARILARRAKRRQAVQATRMAERAAAAPHRLADQTQTRRVALAERPLSSFARCDSLEQLLSATRDSIWIAPDPQQVSDPLNDIGSGAYVLAVMDALVLPGDCILPVDSGGIVSLDGMPDGIGRRNLSAKPSHLVVTGDNAIFAGSFMRGKVAPAALHRGPDGWSMRIPEAEVEVGGTAVYRELATRHFGHMLVDVPGRAWVDLFDPDRLLRDMPQVAFGINGLRAETPLAIPSYGRTLLEVFGITPDRVEIPVRPTRYARLIVPSRIAPSGTTSGPLYSRLAQQAGDRLVAGTHPPVDLPSRVFLSRSRLPKGVSRVVGLPEARIDEVFAEAGFAIVHPQELSLADQVHMARAAREVAGVVGSQLHLTAFSRRRGIRVIQVRPAHWSNVIDRQLMAPLGGSVVAYTIAGLKGDTRSVARAPLNLTEESLVGMREFLAGLPVLEPQD